MPKSKQICEHSLRWILAVRRRADIHQYNTHVFTHEKFPEVLGDVAGDYRHSVSSMIWTVKQAKTIDQIGLLQWALTDDALGYKYAREQSFNMPWNDILR
jgi:hypothetical protein